MTRNLSLIPTIEAEPEAAPPAAPPRAAPARAPSGEKLRRLAIVAAPPARAHARPPRASRSAIGIEASKYAGIVLLFVALAWPLYVWIGK